MKAPPFRWLDALRKIPFFADIPEDQLRWLAGQLEHVLLEEGAYLFEQDAPLDRMVIILKGKIAFVQEQKDGQREIRELGAGSISGALPYSRATHAQAAAKATEPAELLTLHKSHFREMILEHPQLVEVLVHIMTSRVRDFTKSQQQSDKMESLGRLSAGLTHELNNPAAAVARSARALKEQLQSMPTVLQKVICSPNATELLQAIQELTLRLQRESTKTLSLLERTVLADSWRDWLEKRNIEQANALAESFAEYPLHPDDLPPPLQQEEQLEPLLRWLSHLLSLQQLTDNIQHSSARISELVSAVKAYSHMDRSPDKEKADIRQGLRNTLVMLNFKLKRKSISVEQDIPENLPEACVYTGELNQLWTNLIDNAIDAMDNGGRLRISIQAENEKLKIELEDNGKGIPQEVQEQIFDPFFTTKAIGEGSGIGLDVAKRIVEHHGGSLELQSRPGKTVFTVYLPL